MKFAFAHARRLAAAHPEATLPCPACSAMLNAPNLEHHLTQVHEQAEGAHEESGAITLTGTDRGLRRPLAFLTIASGAVFAAVVGITGPEAGALAAIASGLFGASFVVLALALFEVFRARIELEGDVVRLRWAFGLASRAVRLPAALEAGSLIERRAQAGTHQLESPPGEDVVAGGYLRLSSGGSEVVLGATKGARLGKHWAATGWSQGKKTRRWDITLQRPALLAVEYHLAARGLLKPRGK